MDYKESRIEYCNYIADRIFNKLKDEQEYELLTYALCGMCLGLRNSDILKLEWDQFDLENKIIKNVILTKLSNQRGKEVKIDITFPVNLSIPFYERFKYALDRWSEMTDDKIKVFPNLKTWGTSDRIGEIIGVLGFNTHDLRSMSIVLLDGISL